MRNESSTKGGYIVGTWGSGLIKWGITIRNLALCCCKVFQRKSQDYYATNRKDWGSGQVVYASEEIIDKK